MDELSSRVRELAPDAEVSTLDVQRAREALHAEIAGAGAITRRPVRRSAARRWRLPSGAVAAAAAIAVVAIIAAGAVVASQWLSRPAPQVADTWSQMDPTVPLLDQLAEGSYLKVEIIAESPSRFEDDRSEFSPDSHVVVRTVSAHYLSRTEAWIAVSGERPPVVVDTVGPDGDAMAALVPTDEPPYVYDADAPGQPWLDALPDDADRLFAAFAERMGSGPPETAADRAAMGWAIMQDPAWYAIAPEQRRVVVDAMSGAPGATTTTLADGTIELSRAEPFPMTVRFDSRGLLPLTGETGDPSLDAGSELVGSTWTTHVSIVTEAPSLEIPDSPATSSCNGVPIPGSVFSYDSLEAMLDDESRAAITGDGVPELAPDEWALIAQSTDEVVLWSWVLHGRHETNGPVPSGMAGVTHELMTISRVGGAWTLSGWETCVLKQLLPDHEVTDVELDPSQPPADDSSRLHLRVTTTGCSDAAPEVVELAEFDDVVEVLIGQPRAETGEENCDPVVSSVIVELSAELGDRGIRDLTYMEERTLR